MKRRIIRAVTLCLALILACAPVIPSGTEAAESAPIATYSSPALCTDVGVAVDLNKAYVQFTDKTDPVPGSAIVWKDGNSTVTSYTPVARGIYPLTATSGSLSRTVYIVAKEANETEYVLYENDFSVAPDMTQFRIVEQPSGTSVSYDAAETALVLDSSNNGANHVRVLLPAFLDTFGDAIYSARIKITNQTAASRWGSLMFRVQNGNYPYMQGAVRYNMSESNGLEIAERTSANAWNVVQKGSGSANASNYFDITVAFAGKTSTNAINGKVMLTETATPYNTGAMGLQIRGAKLTVDSIKITVNPNTAVAPTKLLHDVRDPESNVVLAPSLIAEVKTKNELAALSTTLPAIAILDAALKDDSLAVTLDGTDYALSAPEAALDEKIIPAYRVESKAEAEALGRYALGLSNCDMYVISSDLSLITAARAVCDMLYGIYDAPDYDGDIESLRAEIIKGGARGAILSAEYGTRDNVSYLQDRYLTVWQRSDGSDVESVAAINKGVLGIVTADVAATEKCFKTYYSLTTLIRTPEIIGHRGAPSLGQENSLAGSIKAFEVGANMVECDIYLMADGNLLVMHDSTLDRTTTGTGNSANQTVNTIKKFVIDVNTAVAPEPIPILDDYFEEFKESDRVVVVEMKSSDTKMAEPLAKLIKKYGMERQVVVIAFSEDMVKAVRAADPTLSVNWLSSSITHNESQSIDVARTVIDTVSPLNTAYSPSQSVGTLGINLYRELAYRGITVWNWTVNNQNDFNKYFVSGIRGITTNYPQWAGSYIEQLDAEVTAGTLTVTATRYDGNTSTPNSSVVCVDGKVNYDSSSGKITLDGCDEAYFFVKYTGVTTSGQSYTVVTPLIHVDADSLSANGTEDTTAEDTSADDTANGTGEITGPVEEGCASSISAILFIALIPAAVVFRKKD